MTTIIIIIAAWILFSTLLVTCLCIRSGQISRQEEDAGR